jgi:hypothetical protein
MQRFARWTGFAAALGAAFLAQHWILAARPEAETAHTRDQFRICAYEHAVRLSDAIQQRDFREQPPLAVACPGPRREWDEALVQRGVIAGVAAVVFLLLAALVPRRH